ncbi:uncharacterized protein G2W53_039139 [Senna tora]|uniref:Uncharacterized protein n=1 Tax=Senna tora TaxID=362788 RepID=A0A834SM91_9FABA|nr:uncharacterized protein G2W53_039139 [Senna tora]
MAPKVELTKLQEQGIGMKRGCSGTREEEGEEMLLGFEIMRRLTEKRSPMEPRSRKSGAEARLLIIAMV